MFIAAIAHIIAFPVTPYKVDQQLNWWWNIANAANVSDFHSEVSTHTRNFYDKVKTVFKRDSKNCSTGRNSESNEEEPDENTKLLNGSDGKNRLNF